MTTYPTRIDLFRALPPGTVGAEIGVYRGHFSEELLKLPIKRLHLVDCWQHQQGAYEADVSNVDQGGHDANYREVVTKFAPEINAGRVVVHREFSANAVKMVQEPLDWVYLDGDHTYEGCLVDLWEWRQKLKPGGFISGHDYSTSDAAMKMGFGVVRAVNYFCSVYGWRMTAITAEEWPSYKLERV
jgi:hypothetical protein